MLISMSPTKKERRALGKELATMQLGHLVQVIAFLSLMLLVWNAHHKAGLTMDQLIEFQQEDSFLMLHLQKIEQQSIQLHETLRLRVGESESAGLDGRRLDSKVDILKDQTDELYQMKSELKKDVSSLQAKIQDSSIEHIVREYGEGPVKVVLDLEGLGQIHILLWPDTPHAAWTWLEQISRNVWDGASLAWTEPNVIDGAYTKRDPLNRGKLEFVESEHAENGHRKGGHEAWTVGLKQTDTGKLGMFINLQDNNQYYKGQISVGKIIDGFDALQKLLEASRNNNHDSNSSVRITSANAMHITHREKLKLVGTL
jgi:cyclophilin family peptidyl-prolyl cis-trans isomerase